MANQARPVTTVAYSVERVRAEQLRHARIPKDLLNRAVAKLESQLEAKETKFFTYRGEVTERVDVVAHDIQQSAADRILKMSGVYVQERETKPPAPMVMIETDPTTGVVRLVIGGSQTTNALGVTIETQDQETDDASEALPLSQAGELEGASRTPEAEPRIIKVRKNGIPDDIKNLLWPPDDD